MKIIEGNWYDYPEYYDLAFQEDTKLEADFIEAAAKKYVPFPVKTLLEPGCGTGRLVLELLRRKYKISAFDLNEKSLEFLKSRLKKSRKQADIFQADMADFRCETPVDLAYNPCNTFRHLLTEEATVKHLQCVSKSLKPGGIYILGLHVIPPDASLEAFERWSETSGDTKVSVTMKVVDSSRRTRLEILRTIMTVTTPEQKIRVRTDMQLRLYTARQLKASIAAVPDLRIVDVFDFWFEIDNPMKLNDDISDTVLVLQKRSG